MKSDKDEEGLRGPARSVRTRLASMSSSGGNVAERPSRWQRVTTYDVGGSKIEEISYGDNGSLHDKTIFTYDVRGKLTEVSKSDSGGAILQKSVYSHDLNGKRVEIIDTDARGAVLRKNIGLYDDQDNHIELATYQANGTLLMKMIQTFDDRGRVAEGFICHGDVGESVDPSTGGNQKDVRRSTDGAKSQTASTICGDGYLASKVVPTYDDRKNLVEHAVYTPDGVLMTKKVVINDAFGNPIEIVDYTADGTTEGREKYTRDYDSHGNWIKQTKSRLNMKTGMVELVETMYREISYH